MVKQFSNNHQINVNRIGKLLRRREMQCRGSTPARWGAFTRKTNALKWHHFTEVEVLHSWPTYISFFIHLSLHFFNNKKELEKVSILQAMGGQKFHPPYNYWKWKENTQKRTSNLYKDQTQNPHKITHARGQVNNKTSTKTGHTCEERQIPKYWKFLS